MKDFDWLPLAAVRPWAKNPRKNQKAVPKVAESLRRFGFVAPVVIWPGGDRLVAGHTRLLALQELLAKEPGFVPKGAPGPGLVPVRFQEFATEREADAYAIADNKLGEIAEWDDQPLADILKDLQGADADLLAATGFTDGDLAQMFPPLPEQPDGGGGEAAAEDPSEALRAKWATAAGQIWSIPSKSVPGRIHRVICGDCRTGDWLRLVGEERLNVVFTSPPYASQRKYDESSGFKPIPPDEYIAWWEAVQANMRATLAKDGSFFVNIKEHCEDGQRHLYVKDLTVAHVRRWGWRLVDELCWHRHGPPGRWPERLKNNWEPIFHFAGGDGKIKFRVESVGYESAYVPLKGAARSEGQVNADHYNRKRDLGDGIALPGNVIDVCTVETGTGHTAAFPVGLPTFFVKAFSDAGDLVADPFLGSGTSMVAAERERRICYGAELSPGYVAVILERLAKMGLEPRLA